jgi:hypothetical protein
MNHGGRCDMVQLPDKYKWTFNTVVNNSLCTFKLHLHGMLKVITIIMKAYITLYFVWWHAILTAEPENLCPHRPCVSFLNTGWKASTAMIYIPYILKSNLHAFYSFRGLKNQMRIRIACGLDSWSRAGFWKNDTATVRAVRTIQWFITVFIIYNIYNLLFIRLAVEL